jgi:TPR repeat protein
MTKDRFRLTTIRQASRRAVGGALLSVLAADSAACDIDEALALYLEGGERASQKLMACLNSTQADVAFQLGRLLQEGKDIKPSEYWAGQFYRRAATAGHPEAQYRLGLMYLNGAPGLEQDDNLALEWVRRAADNGVREAKFLCDYMMNTEFTFGC